MYDWCGRCNPFLSNCTVVWNMQYCSTVLVPSFCLKILDILIFIEVIEIHDKVLHNLQGTVHCIVKFMTKLYIIYRGLYSENVP